jgi:DNA-directed RNA polymerase subunit RPC12/RpoP
MALHIECPDCGETEELVGGRGVEGIGLTCLTCGATFLRDRRLRCATCGGTELVMRPQVLAQYSRGTQLSVVGWTETHCCTSCDAEALQRSERANAPLPGEYRPRAMHQQSLT